MAGRITSEATGALPVAKLKFKKYKAIMTIIANYMKRTDQRAIRLCWLINMVKKSIFEIKLSRVATRDSEDHRPSAPAMLMVIRLSF